VALNVFCLVTGGIASSIPFWHVAGLEVGLVVVLVVISVVKDVGRVVVVFAAEAISFQ